MVTPYRSELPEPSDESKPVHAHTLPRRIVLIRRIGLVASPLLALLVYMVLPSPIVNAAGEVTGGLAQPGRAVAALATLMAALWITEALPVPATALIPIAWLPLLTGGAVSVKQAATPYANDLIYLFMGGFMLARAMQQWGLHRRIALHTILLVGTKPTAMVGGFMIATAFLSMWVSNTATVIMMIPIALSVMELVHGALRQEDVAEAPKPGEPFAFAICLMLGTAYAASIGGIGTLIGTPPNLLLAAFLEKQYGIEISFVRWLGIGLPLVVMFLPITWLLLTRMIFPIRLRRIPGGRSLIRRELDALGPMSRGEWSVLIVFGLTAVAWIVRPLLVKLTLGGGARPLAGLTDAGIAIGAAVVMFAWPIHFGRGVFLLSWEQARKLPWGILILFGGGLSLAEALRTTGVAELIGRQVSSLSYLPGPVVILIITGVVVFLTELTSNTATTATFLPILGAVAVGLGMSPVLLTVPMAIAASCAFMMPVATPPNAIVFASGEITIPQMCKAGLWLNVVGIGLVMLLMYTVAEYVLPLELS